MSPPIKLVNEVRPYLLQIGLLTVLWTAFSMTTPLFTGISSVYAVVEGFAVLGLISVGLLVPVLAGELDLSVAAMAALAGGIAVRNADLGLAAALALATLVGMAVGAIQGGLISRLGISSVVFTVGTMLALSGASFLVSDNAAMPLRLLRLGPAARALGVPVPEQPDRDHRVRPGRELPDLDQVRARGLRHRRRTAGGCCSRCLEDARHGAVVRHLWRVRGPGWSPRVDQERQLDAGWLLGPAPHRTSRDSRRRHQPRRRSRHGRSTSCSAWPSSRSSGPVSASGASSPTSSTSRSAVCCWSSSSRTSSSRPPRSNASGTARRNGCWPTGDAPYRPDQRLSALRPSFTDGCRIARASVVSPLATRSKDRQPTAGAGEQRVECPRPLLEGDAADLAGLHLRHELVADRRGVRRLEVVAVARGDGAGERARADRERDALARPRLEQAGGVAGEQDPAAAERAARGAAAREVAGVVDDPLPVEALRPRGRPAGTPSSARGGRARRSRRR